MRTPEDALRSVKRYVSEVLQPQPILAELVASDGVSWTFLDWAADAISVDRPTWDFLLTRSRTHTLVGTPTDPVYYVRGVLKEDSVAIAAAAGTDFDLRLGEQANTEWNLPLEPAWEVRLDYDYGEVPTDRPFALVGLVGSVTTAGSAWSYDIVQTLSIECLLPEPETGDEAHVNALRLMQTLTYAFHGPGVGLGRTIRVPLYDYEGSGFQDGAAVYRHPSDFMRVQDFSPRLLPDPNDPRRIPVVADLRVTWRVTNNLQAMKVKGAVVTEEIRVEGTDEVFTEGVTIK